MRSNRQSGSNIHDERLSLLVGGGTRLQHTYMMAAATVTGWQYNLSPWKVAILSCCRLSMAALLFSVEEQIPGLTTFHNSGGSSPACWIHRRHALSDLSASRPLEWGEAIAARLKACKIWFCNQITVRKNHCLL